MISKEEFVELIDWHEKQNERLDKLNEIIPDCFSADIFDSPFMLFSKTIRICFDKEGVEWIDWWLYDSPDDDKSYTENGQTFNVETADDLWKLVKGCRK